MSVSRNPVLSRLPDPDGVLGSGSVPGSVVGSVSDVWAVVGQCLGLVGLGAGVGWWAASTVPFVWLISALVGLGVALFVVFRPRLSAVLVPFYCVVEGVFVGAVSRVYEDAFSGVVVQALLLVAVICGLMFIAYSSGRIVVNSRYRSNVMFATLAVLGVYLLSFVLSFFGTDIPFLHESGFIGVIISLVIVGVAAANLAIDFELIERWGSNPNLESWQRWFAAFGLVVTLVWLYVEVLELLGKLRD